MTEDIKKASAFAAVDAIVKSGMKVGLGTGSTAIWAVRRIAELLEQKKLERILSVTTSFQTELECFKLGVPVRTLNDPEIGGSLDVAIDGADEVDPEFNLIKGGGGALLLEKIVAYSSKRFVVVIDSSKIKKRLGEAYPIPIEVMPIARESVYKKLEPFTQSISLRPAVRKAGPVITDNGNMIFDIVLKPEVDPVSIEEKFKIIPGIVEVGIFSKNVTDVFVAYSDNHVEHKIVKK